MSTDILQSLRELAEDITRKIKNPNYGGCGVIAGLVGMQLQRMGVVVDIVTPDGKYVWDGVPASEIRHLVRDETDPEDWDSNGLNRGHMAVRFLYNGVVHTWDSDGIHPEGAQGWFGKEGDRTDSKLGEGLTPTETLRMVSNPEGWNSTFNRKQIPKIENLVMKHLPV